MITDQKQTGVPSATRGRMQLAKPVQTNNSGLVGQKEATEQKMQNRISENYNPIMAKGESDVSSQPSVQETPSATAQNFMRQTVTDLDAARSAFNKLTDKDKMSLLNEIANGSSSARQTTGNRFY